MPLRSLLQGSLNMKFEVINKENNVVMNTENMSCIPSQEEITVMTKEGYKFRLNGKILSKKSLNELIKGRAYES